MRGSAVVISGWKRSDVGAVGATSVTIKHSKQIGLRVTFPHIFPKWNTRFLPLHIHPATCDEGVGVRGCGEGGDQGPL